MDRRSQPPTDRPEDARARLARLLAAGPALELDAWALAPAPLEFALAEVAAGRERVLECGSGISTVLIARLLRERERGSVRALEHDPAWAARTRERLAAEGLQARARVIEARLRPDPLAAAGCEWYDRAALAALARDGVDLLLVDGPPASPERGLARARYPALPVLAARLADGATVVLDDADRAGEIWVLERWQRELGIVFERRDGFAFARLSRTRRRHAGKPSPPVPDGGPERSAEGCMLRAY